MTMDDICKEINCKHIKWSNGGRDSMTCWLECKLKNTVTGPDRCAKCPERVPKGVKNSG